MTTLTLALLFFIASVATHLIFCRNSSSKSLKGKLFIQISILLLLIYIGIAFILKLPLIISCSAIYILLIPAYMVVYVTTELVSPSKKILQSLAASQGLTRQEIIAYLEKENLIQSRLDELVQSGCIMKKDEYYVLTANGSMLASFLRMFGLILGRGVGG